ncbi:hypothetical protein I5F63_032940 [Pseudomonas aeruginosa]
MADMTSQDMRKLLAAGFERAAAQRLRPERPGSGHAYGRDVDQLRPYDHDLAHEAQPGFTREIKASIRERGLDAALAITRRPAREDHASTATAACNNITRLAILQKESWSETKGRTLLPHIVPVPTMAGAR